MGRGPGSRCAWIGITLLLVVGAGHAAVEKGGDVGLQLGVLQPDTELTGEPRNPSTLTGSIGFRGDYFYHDHWGWFVDTTWSRFGTSTPAEEARIYTTRLGFQLMSHPHTDRFQTIFSFGGGWMNVDLERAPSFDHTFFSLGVGQRFRTSTQTRFRWELRADRSITEGGLEGVPITQVFALLGVGWGVGVPRPDQDEDGVRDRRDDCPNTPFGAVVDRRGCPFDGDRDGVFDGIDRCPDTPAGWPVDLMGCPTDGDGDGVADGIDRCPSTPRGATVDRHGCSMDEDGDQVPDGIDECPGTPVGATVDERGCPRDSDGDGVPDGIDECPETPRGARVDPRGCSLDGDGDGVPDGIDRCPDTPRGTHVDEFGCRRARPLFEAARQTLVLDGVQFEVNRAVLAPASALVLDRVAESLVDWPEVRIEIGGHTDSTGAAEYNLRLSELRAEAVLDYLAGSGVSRGRMNSKGYGETVPIADNDSASGRSRNRRVELKRLE